MLSKSDSVPTLAPPQKSPALGGQAASAPVAQPASKRSKKGGFIRLLIFGIIFIVAAVLGFKWWTHLQTFEETDDAYVTGHNHPISFRVTGTISEVLIDDNQMLKTGQPIARLDPRDFEVQLKEVQADLERAKGQLIQSQAQIVQTEAQLGQAEAQAAAVKAKADDSKRIFDRNSELMYHGRGVVSKQDLDNAQFQYSADQANYNASVASVKVTKANIDTAKAQKAAATAQVASAQSAVENAQLQLSYTTLYAPVDGRVAKKTLEVGQRVQPGQSLLAIVEPYVWVEANYKETQLGRIRPGQEVEIVVDSIQGKTFHGKVDSFQPGSGAVFALLPPDNATGNFTKIVQRLPVKIVFDPESVKSYENLIVPGLSVQPSIKVQ